MKQTVFLTILLLFTGTSIFAQHMGNANRKSPHDTVAGKHIVITYGRPYKKGRVIFGDLVPFGQVWRVGADEATQITIDKDCTFAGKQLKAGTYTLFAIPDKNNWTIILNGELGQWGAFGYDKVKDKNVLESTVASKHQDKSVEQFTIAVNKEGLLLDWDQTAVAIPVKF